MFGFWQDQIDRELRQLRRLEARERETVRDQPLREGRPRGGIRGTARLGIPEGVRRRVLGRAGDASRAAGARDHAPTGVPVAVAPGRCE
jgi:hypothetical protein